MFCNHCGSEIEKDSRYCPQCGINLNVDIAPSYIGEKSRFCNTCGIATSGNYCSNCGHSCETVKSVPLKGEALKKTFTAFNQKAQKHTEYLNKSVFSNALIWCRATGTTIKDKCSDKNNLKAYGLASIAALLSSYFLALVLWLVIQQMSFVKEGYQTLNAFGKGLPNFMDMAHLAWQSIFKGKVVIQGGDGFSVILLSSVHFVILFAIPVFSVWVSQKVLKKNMKAKIIDYGIVSVIFTVMFHIISIANQHSISQEIYIMTLELSYGVLLFRNIIGIGLIFFLLSLLFNPQMLAAFNQTKYIKQLEKIKSPLILGLRASLQILVFGSALTFVIILFASVFFEMTFTSVIFLLLIVWPNVALNSINLLFAGTMRVISDESTYQLFSLFDVLKYYSHLIGDEPIFLVGLVVVIAIFTGVVVILIGQLNQLGKNRELMETAVYAGTIFLVTQIVAYTSQWFGVVKMRGDIPMLGYDRYSAAVHMGFFNMNTFISSALFLGVIILGGSMVISKFKLEDWLENAYKVPKKKIMIYSVMMLVLIVIQIVVIKQYSYGGSNNILMGIIISKLSIIRDDLSDIFSMFDMIEYLF
jgi:hypothetical protein